MRRTVTLAKCLVNCHRSGPGGPSSAARVTRSAVLAAVAVAVAGGFGRAVLRRQTLARDRPAPRPTRGRVALIRQRGTLVCGVAPGVAGFARVDSQGRYSGLDVDVCRAVAAAIFGTADKVRYEQAVSVEQFRQAPDVDLVSRRLTWSLQREGMGLLFGPVMFYDGQGFLVPARLPAQHVRELANARICVVAGGLNESNLTIYFRSHALALRKVLIETRAARRRAPGGTLRRVHGRCLGTRVCAERDAKARRLQDSPGADLQGTARTARAAVRRRFVQRPALDYFRDDQRGGTGRDVGQSGGDGEPGRPGHQASARRHARQRQSAGPRRSVGLSTSSRRSGTTERPTSATWGWAVRSN